MPLDEACFRAHSAAVWTWKDQLRTAKGVTVTSCDVTTIASETEAYLFLGNPSRTPRLSAADVMNPLRSFNFAYCLSCTCWRNDGERVVIIVRKIHYTQCGISTPN